VTSELPFRSAGSPCDQWQQCAGSFRIPEGVERFVVLILASGHEAKGSRNGNRGHRLVRAFRYRSVRIQYATDKLGSRFALRAGGREFFAHDALVDVAVVVRGSLVVLSPFAVPEFLERHVVHLTEFGQDLAHDRRAGEIAVLQHGQTIRVTQGREFFENGCLRQQSFRIGSLRDRVPKHEFRVADNREQRRQVRGRLGPGPARRILDIAKAALTKGVLRPARLPPPETSRS